MLQWHSRTEVLILRCTGKYLLSILIRATRKLLYVAIILDIAMIRTPSCSSLWSLSIQVHFHYLMLPLFLASAHVFAFSILQQGSVGKWRCIVYVVKWYHFKGKGALHRKYFWYHHHHGFHNCLRHHAKQSPFCHHKSYSSQLMWICYLFSSWCTTVRSVDQMTDE